MITVGAPLVTLISMVSSYRDKLEENTKKIEHLYTIIHDLQSNTTGQTSNIEVVKQDIMYSQTNLSDLQKSEDKINERILELYRDTSKNSAEIEALRVQLNFMQSERRKN